MLGNRLRKNQRRLQRMIRSEALTCYRLYDRDIPEIPLVVDWYEGRLHIAEYLRKTAAELPEVDHQRWIGILAESAAIALGVSPERVFLKRRQRQRGTCQYERVADFGEKISITEGGLRFWINLSDYLDTGLFLDHRLTRSLVRHEAKGRRVLNLFGYTGSFSVYAAAGGALETTTVDLSKTYLDWARANFALNGYDCDQQHHLIQADALAYLDQASGSSQRFDLIVVDPPSFSNSKRMRQGTFDVRRDHGVLLQRSLRLLSPGGVLFFSTNSRQFKLETELFAGAEVFDISEQTIPADFRDRRVHRCFRMTPTGLGHNLGHGGRVR